MTACFHIAGIFCQKCLPHQQDAVPLTTEPVYPWSLQLANIETLLQEIVSLLKENR